MGTENTGQQNILWKKAKPRSNFITTTSGKSLLADALHDLHASECKGPLNRTYYCCLWKPAERNKVCTSKQLRDLLRALKHLMETRLSVILTLLLR